MDADRLARAAAEVGATDMGDGRWAYYADETSRWYVMPAKELEELCDYLDHDDPQIRNDAYSHWCAGHSEVMEMPRGWEPR